MTTRWKIFRAANIVEIILVASMITLILYQDNMSIRNPGDRLGFLFFGIVLGVVIGNCTNNILLLRFVSLGHQLPFKKKFSFWSLFVLFLLFVGLVIWGFEEAYTGVRRETSDNNHRIKPRVIAILLWMLAIAVNGIYLSWWQVALFRKLKRNYIENSSLLITEIGETTGS